VKVAVVGPREGGDTDVAADFCRELYRLNPEIVLVSGGAKGIDQVAETTWHGLGGRVWSYRIRKLAEDSYGVEKWEYGGDEPPLRFLIEAEPTFADPVSALTYRSMLAVEASNRVVAFAGQFAWHGTQKTISLARELYHKPVHLWRDGRWEEP